MLEIKNTNTEMKDVLYGLMYNFNIEKEKQTNKQTVKSKIGK